MLRLLAHRAVAQMPLLAAVVAVVTVGATLLGVCALLLTASQERALDEGMARAAAPDVEVTAFAVGIPGENTRSVAEDTRKVVTQAVAPFAATSDARASSIMRSLGKPTTELRRLAYLSSIDDLASRARLTAGRWPQASGQVDSPVLESAVLDSTARLLNLAPGSRVILDAESPSSSYDTQAAAVTVEIVGIFRSLPGAGWDRDPLGALGYLPAYTDREHMSPAPAYGPFVVELADLLASRSTIDRLQVTAHPDLSTATKTSLDAVSVSLADAGNRLKRVLGDRVDLQRITSEMPHTLALAHAQQAVTRSTVLVVVLLGTALTAAALGLAGRLVAALRSSETVLLSALGATRSQLAVVAAAEATLLAIIAAVIAIPLSGLTHAALTHLPALADAGLAARPGVTSAQVEAVVIGATLLAGVLVIPALRPDPEQGVATRGRLSLLTRSGSDLLLLGLAAVGWWQLRAQPATETGTDVVRVLAPVLCLVAGAAVAPRLVSLPLRAAERVARGSRGLVLPLAAFEAARRPRAVAASLLLVLAASAGTFGLAFGATWERSQRDQADARIGTDLALPLAPLAAAGQGSAVAAATGGTVSPVTDRGVVIGEWLGTAGDGPRMVAVDTTQAGTLLRGRQPTGTTWAEVGSALAPSTPVTGVALGATSQLTITGTATGGSLLRAVPRLVLQDSEGLRSPCDAEPFALDGLSHPLRLCGPLAEGLRVIAVSLEVNLDPTASGATGESLMTVTLSLPATQDATGGNTAWKATSVGTENHRLTNAAATETSTPTTTILQTTATINLSKLLPEVPVEVVATAFAGPAGVPIAVSRRLIGALGASVGDPLVINIAGTPVPAVVAEILPRIPSAPGEMAMLADVDLLSRALIVTGNLEPAVDAWWVGRPTQPDAAARVTALGLGRVETSSSVSEELSRGPLRVGLPAALVLLIPAAVLLALVGMLMHVTSDVEARAVEMARLRGLGVTRRSVLGGLLAQHGGVLALLIGAGTVVGAVASWAVGPLLIRSDLGASPVPAALVQWPWLAETGLLAVLLIGGTAAVALVVSVQLRRADAAHLRVGA